MPVEPVWLSPEAVDDLRDPVGVWRARTDAGRLVTDDERACLLAAQRQADVTWNAAARGHLDADAMLAGVCDEGWHRLAVTAYHLMSTSSAYAHLAGFQHEVCSASTDLKVWLAWPAYQPGVGTIADALIGGEDGRYDNAAPAEYLADLIAAAQSVGLFGVPDYRIGLAAGLGEDAGRVRITLDAAHGPSLASGLLPIRELVNRNLHGVDAALTALGNTSLVVDAVMRRRAGATWLGRPPAPSSVRAWTATAEAMPELDLPKNPARPPAEHPVDVAEAVTPYHMAGGRAFTPLGHVRAITSAPHPSQAPRSDSSPTAARHR